MAAGSNNRSERVSNGEAAAVARAISKIEDGSAGAAALMKEIYATPTEIVNHAIEAMKPSK